MPGPRPIAICFSPEEQNGLRRVAARHNTGQQVALRARNVLAVGAGGRNAGIARALEVNIDTVRLPSREQTGRGGGNAGSTYNPSRWRT